MSRSEVDALNKDECLQLMEHLGDAQPRRGVLVLELKSMIKDLIFPKGGEQEKPLLCFAKMNRGQLAEKARQLQILVYENHTRGHLIKIIREDHCSKRLRRALTTWVSASTEPRGIKKFYSWIATAAIGSIRWKSHDPTGVFQETNRENNMTQGRMTRRIKQLEEEKLFAEMQASKALDQTRKTPKQKGANPNTALEEEKTP